MQAHVSLRLQGWCLGSRQHASTAPHVMPLEVLSNSLFGSSEVAVTMTATHLDLLLLLLLQRMRRW
jgi:hypothetical protein